MMNEMALLLSVKELDCVVGGDYGDTEREIHAKYPMYKSGDEIEVYDNCFHTTTEHAKILSRWDFGNGHYKYWVEFRDVFEKDGRRKTGFVIADDIER